MYDLLIKNGKIIDGTGSPSYFADVAVSGGKIVKIGKGLEGAARVIDAAGLTVTPGFIDSHSHSDSAILSFPQQREKVEQGITTCIGGQCGESIAPLSKEANPADYGEKYEILKSMDGFLDRAKSIPQGCNIAVLVGHGNLRESVMGMENRAPTSAEMAEMKARLRKALEHGALGLSFGLFYAPSAYADTEEAIELAKVVAEYDGVIAAHIRNEKAHLVKAVREFLTIAKESGARAVVSHHKSYGNAENWGKVTHTLRMIDEANAEGCNVYCDVYPYDAAGTRIVSMFLPPEEHARGVDAIVRDLDTPEYRKYLREYITGLHGTGFSWVKTTSGNPYPECEGMTLPEIAKVRGCDEFDAMFDIMRDSRLRVSACFFTICEEDIETVIAHPRAMICTDSGVVGKASRYHPRLRGSFPRALGHYVRERKVVTLPEMIRKITAMPARVYGLTTKGLIWENMDADICIFDENTVREKCSYDNIGAHAEGLACVIVGGKIAAEKAYSTEELKGKVLIFER